ASAALPAGLYLTALQWEEPVLGKIVFRPLQPMQFFPLPVQQGQTFSSAGFDPESRVALSLRGQFTGRKRIDACGALIDTWELKLSEVMLLPDGQLTIDATHDIATQYGGLSV